MAGYIGGTFSLISSTARVRYTGILAEVNQTDGSIILNNVLSHGTENRRSLGKPAIPPSQEVHMGIRFLQNEIEDIVQIQEMERYTTRHGVPDDLSQSQQGVFQQQQPPPQQYQQQQYGGWGQPPPQQPPPQQQYQQQGYQQQQPPQQGFGQAPPQAQRQQPAGLVPPPARPGAVPAQSAPAPARVMEAAKPAYVKPTSFAAAAQAGLPTSKPKPPPPDRPAPPPGGRGAGGRIPQPRGAGGRGGGRFGNVSNQNLPQSAVVPTEAFDFESMLSKFDKAREQTANDLGVAKYEKDDFFDTMSSDATQKENRSAHFQRMAEQRKVDSETFGREGATHTSVHGRRRGRGRGRGRGGRGGRY